jgi:hypothetical protein
MVAFEEIHQYVEVIAGIAEIIIVFLLWKTVLDFSETAKVSRLQSDYRFRPWVGPSSGIQYMQAANGKSQYSITVKNFAEIPASKVVVKYAMKKGEMPKREILKQATAGIKVADSSNGSSSDGTSHDGLTTFDLGPLLPQMEKRYWIFIDSDTMKKTKENSERLYTLLHFSYEYAGGRGGYGMISMFDPKTENFVHKDMWID